MRSVDGFGESEMTPFQRDVARVLLSLRRGDVVTYGEVAVEAGHPGAARAVGSFLRHADGNAYPWWRVVAADGHLVAGHATTQAARLRAEGFEVTDDRVLPKP